MFTFGMNNFNNEHSCKYFGHCKNRVCTASVVTGWKRVQRITSQLLRVHERLYGNKHLYSVFSFAVKTYFIQFNTRNNVTRIKPCVSLITYWIPRFIPCCQRFNEKWKSTANYNIACMRHSRWYAIVNFYFSLVSFNYFSSWTISDL